MEQKFGAVIVAAGNSTRMGGKRSKVLEALGGRPVLWYSLTAFSACREIAEIVVVCREEDLPEFRTVMERFQAGADRLPDISLVTGGAERQDSVRRGVEALSAELEYIVIHDGARPMVTPEVIRRVCADAVKCGAATAAVPCKDTCKLGTEFVEETPPREKLYAVQTPQAFRRDMYLYALDRAEMDGRVYTDDCQLIEAAGGRVRLSEGDYRNIKLTTPEDLLIARAFLEKEKTMVRVGYGYDVHRLAEGRKLILGGVEVPFEKGLLGHSDADVLAHAISDALLGAAALGDIGRLFPDNDPRFEGADSMLLLSQVCALLRQRHFEIDNIDGTVIAQRPKLAPYISKMRERIAAACGIPADQVSVKATTEEGLGFTGTGEGIAASAVCCCRC